MQKRKLKDLNLLDDFLFNSMVTYPGIGEEFSRELLKIIFQKDLGKLTVIPQKTYYGSDTDMHGTRLDVYLEEDESEPGILSTSTIYDLEPNLLDNSKMISSLPKRMRFYHAKIDARSLKSGESYHNLKNVIVIMITPFDPFELNRMVYTIRNKCEEAPDMQYDDGASTLFLYTEGTEGNPSLELRQLLQYMKHTTRENAQNEVLQNIHKMVEVVKQDQEVSLAYMKIFEREEYLIEQGMEQGMEQERANTERERKRADVAEQRAETAEKEVEKLKKELEKLKGKK